MVAANGLEPSLQAVYVGRQAILNDRQDVVGYELLYRDHADAHSATQLDPVTATARVLINSVAGLGIATVVGTRDIYINCSRGVLDLPLHELLPSEQVVLEVLEDVPVTDSLRVRLRELRDHGFRIALDDYVLGDPRAALTELVDVIKVDILQVPEPALPRVRAELDRFSGHLLAEKVEDQLQFETCLDLGFELFQGYFFCRPAVLSRVSPSSNKINALRILAEAQRPGISLDEIATLVQQDMSMSYQLLRCLNSSAFGLRQAVDSVRQGLILLGSSRVRAWISLMGLSAVQVGSTEVLRMAMIRATMCQALARSLPHVDPDTMFTIGMFSLLDVVLGVPMEEVVEQLPLGPIVRGTLLGAEGPPRRLLEAVMAYERGDFEASRLPDVPHAEMTRGWLAAVAWVEGATNALLG